MPRAHSASHDCYMAGSSHLITAHEGGWSLGSKSSPLHAPNYRRGQVKPIVAFLTAVEELCMNTDAVLSVPTSVWAQESGGPEEGESTEGEKEKGICHLE